MAPTILTLPPIIGWESVSFDPVRPRSLSRMEGRRTEAVTFGTPYWRASYQAPWLEYREFGMMDAFMMRAGDDGEVFRAYDPFRPRPIAHDDGKALSGTRAAGGAFDGTATLQSITDSRTVVVSGLPASFQFRAGDYAEIRQSVSVVSLHRVQEDAQADALGVVKLSIKYALDTQHFAAGAVVNLEKASCLMQIDPGSYSGRKSWSDRKPSFTAQEVFFS